MDISAITHHTVSIAQVHWIMMGVRRSGVDVDAVLRRAGIPVVLLDSPLARVSQHQYARLIRVMRRVMRDEFWGLAASPVPLGTFSAACTLLIHSRTLGDAFRTGFAFYRRVIPEFVCRLHLLEGTARVQIFSSRTAPAQASECHEYAQRTFLYFGYSVACWLVGRPIPLFGVEYVSIESKGQGDLPRLFRSHVHFGSRHTGLLFDARWLELPVVQDPRSLGEFLRHAPMDLLVRFRDRSTVTEQIRRFLRRQLDQELPSLEEVSHALGMTPHTLRRRLHEEGKGFQQLKDDLRRDAAIEYLMREDLSLVQIAEKLGFSEPSTFHRAFKKWTGAPPGEYRHAQRVAV